jgi:hypothetical protein
MSHLDEIIGQYTPIIVNGVPLEGWAGVNFAYITKAILLIIAVASLMQCACIILKKIGGR